MAQHQAYYDQLFANHFSEDEVPDLLQTTHTPLAESQRKVGSQANRLDGPFLDLSIRCFPMQCSSLNYFDSWVSLSPREADELQRQSILSLKPYVQTKGDVSQADYGELVPKIERTLLRSVWSTEHSTAQVYSGTQVWALHYLSLPKLYSMRISPQYARRQSFSSVLVAALRTMRVSIT